ncbi:MAG TPA: hypothetical protein VKA27_09710 [Sunxiuqinia sp.]|nr:hypothetical protein [Sunxiuqinia sp.]
MKKILILAFLFSCLNVIAQKETRPFDFRFGIGKSLLGSGDYIVTVLENEVNYKLNHYFTTSVSVNFARNHEGEISTTSFIQGNLNLFFSPFRNSRKNDFRLGSGFTVYQVTDAARVAAYYENGVIVDTVHEIDSRNSIGYNIIIEDSYNLTGQFFVGLKLFTQSYHNYDINTGGLLKIGYHF